MSSDPLPFSDVSPASANDPEYESVYAQMMASERGRSFLTEYARRNCQPQTQKLVDTIVRLEAATRENAPPNVPPALVRGLIDLVAAIEQVEAALAASAGTTSGDLFAAERIQDIAMALRQREVDAALCDALEAGTREVGDAIVRNSAAAARVLSAASLLRDVPRRINELIALAAAVQAPVAEPKDEPADNARRGDPDARPESATDVLTTHSSTEETAGSLLHSGPLHPLLPAMQAPTEAEKDLGTPSEPLTPPVPDPLFTAPRREAAPTSAAEGETARPIFSAEAAVSVFSASPSTETKIQKKSLSAATAEQPSVNESPPAPANPRAVTDDPLAALRALSEEELIALFS